MSRNVEQLVARLLSEDCIHHEDALMSDCEQCLRDALNRLERHGYTTGFKAALETVPECSPPSKT